MIWGHVVRSRWVLTRWRQAPVLSKFSDRQVSDSDRTHYLAPRSIGTRLWEISMNSNKSNSTGPQMCSHTERFLSKAIRSVASARGHYTDFVEQLWVAAE